MDEKWQSMWRRGTRLALIGTGFLVVGLIGCVIRPVVELWNVGSLSAGAMLGVVGAGIAQTAAIRNWRHLMRRMDGEHHREECQA